MESRIQKWSEDQLKLAFYLYCQIPFGKMHSKNNTIIEFAKIIGRTPNALAMKLVNFASLDPLITNTGRKGLQNASTLDKLIWNEFHNNWDKLVSECEKLSTNIHALLYNNDTSNNIDYSGKSKLSLVKTRIGQSFFRNAIMSSYECTCCMCGLKIPELLIASHILPWAEVKKERLNPCNGLCLSVIHDKAFDKGFITVMPDYTIKVSDILKSYDNNSKQIKLLFSLHKKKIILPRKFLPNTDFLKWHNDNVFKS